MAHHNLDSLDKKILKLIAEDARMPFLEVAKEGPHQYALTWGAQDLGNELSMMLVT